MPFDYSPFRNTSDVFQTVCISVLHCINVLLIQEIYTNVVLLKFIYTSIIYCLKYINPILH